jgi:glutathione S-transferase
VLDDGGVISESMAICRYFEELQPEPPLMGNGPLGKAMVEMWQRRMELNLLFPVAQTFRHLHPAMKEMEKPQVAQWGEVNRPRVLTMLSLLDSELSGRPFIAGDAFSVADITAMVAVDFMKPAKIERPDNLPNLDRWYGEVSTRPSAGA